MRFDHLRTDSADFYDAICHCSADRQPQWQLSRGTYALKRLDEHQALIMGHRCQRSYGTLPNQLTGLLKQRSLTAAVYISILRLIYAEYILFAQINLTLHNTSELKDILKHSTLVFWKSAVLRIKSHLQLFNKYVSNT